MRALRLKAAWDKMTALAAPLAAAAEAAGQTFEVAVDDTIHFEEPEEEPTEQEAKDKLAAFTDAGEQGCHVAGDEDGLDAQGRLCSRRCEIHNTGTACDKKAVGAYVICPLLPIRIFGTGSLYDLSAASCTHLRHVYLFVSFIETHFLGAHVLAPHLFRPASSSRRIDNFYWSCLCLLFTTDFIPHVYLDQIASLLTSSLPPSAVDKFNMQVYNVRAVLASINGPVSLSGAICELKKHLMAKGHGFDFDFSDFSIKMPSVSELPKPIGMVVEVVRHRD